MAAANRLVSRDAYTHVSRLYHCQMSAISRTVNITSNDGDDRSDVGCVYGDGGDAGGERDVATSAAIMGFSLVSDGVRAVLRSGVAANRAGTCALSEARAKQEFGRMSVGYVGAAMPEGDFGRVLKDGVIKMQATIEVHRLKVSPGALSAIVGAVQGSSHPHGGATGRGGEEWEMVGHDHGIGGVLPSAAAPNVPASIFDVDDLLKWAIAGVE